MIDTSVAHPARRYNYWLGGTHHFPADRASGDAIEAAMPTIRLMATENRKFLGRAAAFVAAQGVRQFLDIGTGIPAPGGLLDCVPPASRIVFVDNDPLVREHAAALTGDGRAYLEGDLRSPRDILGHPSLRATLDLGAPVGLMLVAVLHFVRDDERPQEIVRTLVSALPSGSYLVASHATWEYVPPEAVERLTAQNSDGRFTPRAGASFAAFFEGWSLFRPGWRRSRTGTPATARFPRSKMSAATGWSSECPEAYSLPMSRQVWGTPQFVVRAAIVVCGAVGLLIGDHRVVYFTTQSNLLVLAYFVGALYWMTKRATVEPPAPRWRGAITLWILITCLISHFLLSHGANPLPGLAASGPGEAVANWSLFLVHYVVPVLVLIDWVASGPHRIVRWRDVPLWIAYPLGYGLTIEVRGALFPSVPVKYPYFFLDPTGHGYGWVGLQFVQLAIVFGVFAAAVVGLDRLGAALGGRRVAADAGSPAQRTESEPAALN